MTRIVCRLSSWLPDSTPVLSRLFDRHRETCLRCQADSARLLGVSRDLGALDDEVVEAPGGFHARVMAALPTQDAADPRRPVMIRVAIRYVLVAIGIAVAALAAFVGRQVKRRT